MTLTRSALTAVAVTAALSMLVLAGCSGGVPSGDEPDAGWKKDDLLSDAPVCRVTEGDPDAFPEAVDAVWWMEGGSMRCVTSTPSAAEGGEDALARTRDEAVELAAERLLPGAFEMLERRGASLTPARQDEAAGGFAVAVARGESSGFPRIAIREAVVERCESPDSGEHWRARLLAEYPIGMLRGDVTHAQWEGRRLAREVEMRMESADDLLAEGRWVDAVFQMKAAYSLLLRADPASLPADLGARLHSAFTNTEGFLAPRFVQTEGQNPLVVSAGGRVRVGYRLEFRLGDEWIVASGVPVTIEGGSLVRPAARATETDEAGEIAFDVAAGPEGGDDSFRIVAELFPKLGTLLPYGRASSSTDVAAAVVQNVVVLSSRDATVCVEIHAGSGNDAARVREGIANGLDALGSSLVECGPDASLVVSANVSVTTQETHGTWLARAVCDVRVFDQRVAEDVGEVSFEVKESLESSARDAELLVLREVGRLVTVYLEPRLAER